jgi:uncharacterized protein (UPF0179 family)
MPKNYETKRLQKKHESTITPESINNMCEQCEMAVTTHPKARISPHEYHVFNVTPETNKPCSITKQDAEQVVKTINLTRTFTSILQKETMLNPDSGYIVYVRRI